MKKHPLTGLAASRISGRPLIACALLAIASLPAQAAPGTLAFTSDGAWSDGIAEDGEGGSGDIPGITIQVLNITDVGGANLGTIVWKDNAGFLGSGDSSYSALTYEENAGSKGMAIRSSDGAEFQINGFRYYNWGETESATITVKGYRDGAAVASTDFEGYSAPTYDPIDITLDSSFDNVDDVRLYISAGGYKGTQAASNHSINYIVIAAAAVAPSPPSITSATYDTSTGVLAVTGANLVANAGALNDVAVSLLTLTGNGGNSYTLTSGDVEISSGTTFSVALNEQDQINVGGLLNRNGTSAGSTTYNLAAASNWMPGVASSADLTGNGITVSNIQAPTITSASYDGETGVLTVTATGLLKLVGATNDIVARRFTLTGAGGSTYTLTDTADVEIASKTSFTLTLSATDRMGVNPFMNQNGTFAADATTYNLAAAEDWIAGFDAAWVVADTTGNGVTVSNAVMPPTATIVVADTAMAAGETSLVTITFSRAVSGFANADLTVPNGSLSTVSSSDGGTTWTATFTPAASAADATNVITLDNTGVSANGVAGKGTTDSNNYAIDTARPTAAIVVTDTSLAAGETSAVTITFSEAVTGFANDDLTIGNGSLSTVGSADSGITWTAILTPTASIAAATNVITLDNTGVTDGAGNAGTGTTDSNNYSIDTAAPTATLVVADTELNAGETSAVTITFSEAVTGFDNADLTIANGTLSAVSSGDGGITWTATLTPGAAINAPSNVITLDNTGVEDASGNAGTGTTDSNEFIIRTLAMTLLVTSSLDSDDDAGNAASLADDEADGAGLSLREALNWSRLGDTITFDFDSGTAGNQGGAVTLGGNQLQVSRGNLRIDGDLDDDGTADVTVSADHASRVMLIDNDLSGIELSGLILTEGSVSGGGAGLHIGGGSSITIRNSDITNSTETGLGGGGVYGVGATLTMIDSTVSGNGSSSFGGGIRIAGAGGTLNLINSTVSGNTTTGANAHGGGIQFDGTGGLTIVNGTISGNAAAGAGSSGGGLRISSGTAHVYGSTIVGNASADVGGGVSANGADTFVNTAVAGNTSGAGATAATAGSALATGGVADDVGGTMETATHSYFGSAAAIATDNGSLNNQGTGNLLLGDLHDNGGHGLTHLPQAGSALIDAGSNADLPVDSFDIDGDSNISEALPRDAGGNNRISHGIVEIGAVEVTSNYTPLAGNDSAVTNEDSAVEIPVLANDSDPEGAMDESSVELGAAPAHGTAVVNASGSITYTPALNWNGVDSFSYSVADDDGARSSTATVSITVNTVNDLPVIAGAPSALVNSGTPYTFTPTLSDVESQPLTVSAVNLPSWATLNASTGAITGTPDYDDAGSYSGIVLTVSDGVGSSSLPAFSIVVIGTVDHDGDGMSDVFEQTHGLDQNDPSDATGDSDGDGVSNLDEYLADRDPTSDDYAPVLSSPAPLTIDATGLLTAMPALSPPAAVDGRDGVLTAALTGNRLYLEPGTHILTWFATDAAGNRGETLQAVNVRPLISLARDQTVTEGATAQVRVILNGPSPTYPLSVAYSVGGTAGPDDHDLRAGTVVFEAGELEKRLVVQVAADGIAEGQETIEVALTGKGNFGAQRTHVIRIVETNVVPTLEWSVMQDGHSARIVTQDGGQVTLSAAVHDANVGDTHTYEWNIPAGITTGNTGDSVRTFDPATVTPGVYRVDLTVRDSGTPAQSAHRSLLFQVIAAAPVLSAGADSDADGIDDATEGSADQDGDGQPDYLDVSILPNVLSEKASDGGLYQLEASPGVKLTLGRHAMVHGADGAHLSAEDIVTQSDIGPDSISNVGGYFDLSIEDLAEAGASVDLVIPQRQAIPRNPLYRKFLQGQWVTFVEDAANRLASAPGANGICPPPGGSEYRAGLNPGDWCVRLTLEDGGPNDADGIENAAVEDPGGVGEVATVTSTTRGGGGSMGTPLLMMLVLLALHRMRRLNVARTAATAMALAIVMTVPAQAQAEAARALYVTGTLGYAKTQIDESDMQRDFAAQGIDSTVHSVDAERPAWAAGVGYRIADRWAVEAGYLDLGEVKLSFDTLASTTNLAQVHPLSAQGATISGLYRLPLGDRVDASARLGAFIWDSEYTTRSADVRIDANDDSGADLLWGVALGYRLSSAWTVHLELQRIEFDDQPTHVVSLQAQWRIHSFRD